MQRSTNILVAKCVTILAVIPAIILGYASGPPARHTGAPGESSCTACHSGQLNPSGGNVQITAAEGTTYTPGQRQRMTVTITNTATSARLYGFQASARLVSNISGGQAGTLVPSNNETQVICGDDRVPPCRADTPLQFIEHRNAKAGNTYEFDWTPPASADAGPVRFYVAANAANGNGQDTGDRIFTANITLTPAAASNRPAISDGGIADSFNFQRGLAASTWMSIYGTNLASTTRDWTGSPEFAEGRLPTSLDGVSVSVNGRPAAVYSISPQQVNFLAPTDDSTGDVQVILTNANGASAPAAIRKSALLPALYSPFAQEGRLFLTAVDNATGAILGKPGVEPRSTRSLRPGDVVQLYASGLGPTNPPVAADRLVPTGQVPLVTNTVRVRFGDVEAEVFGSFLQGPGLYQVNIRVPNVDPGDVRVTIEAGGTRSSDNVYASIQR